MQTASGIKRQEVMVQDGDNLSKSRNVRSMSTAALERSGSQAVASTSKLPGARGRAVSEAGRGGGDVDALAYNARYPSHHPGTPGQGEAPAPQGIKVLSLFFIDEVARYRQYDADGNALKGDYAGFSRRSTGGREAPEYNTLFKEVDLTRAAHEVHNGYFSIDKKGSWTDTEENNQANRDNAERRTTYYEGEGAAALVRDSAQVHLLSLRAEGRLGQSQRLSDLHPARHPHERERRQTIGRGLRLCVNQNGERIRGFEVNTLTVVAMESYERFAENLQKEIEEDTGIRFGIVEPHQFAAIVIAAPTGTLRALGLEESKALWSISTVVGYIDARGRCGTRSDGAQRRLAHGAAGVHGAARADPTVLKELAGRLEVKNADERRRVRPRQAVLRSPEFNALWDRIKHKTTYRVHFDNEKLARAAPGRCRTRRRSRKRALQWRKADIAIGKAGRDGHRARRCGNRGARRKRHRAARPAYRSSRPHAAHPPYHPAHPQREWAARRFQANAQQFIELATEAINRCKRVAVVDGIKYQRLGEEHYYAQELFEKEELTGYLKNMLRRAKGGLRAGGLRVRYRGDICGQAREETPRSGCTLSCPDWFTVPTPLAATTRLGGVGREGGKRAGVTS